MSARSNILKTTTRSIEIIKFLETNGSARVSEIAAALDIPPSTVHSHLSTLKEERFVAQKGDLYYLSFRLIALAEQIKKRTRMYSMADQYTEQVVDTTDYRSIFAIEEHGYGVIVSRNAGQYSKWRHERIGERYPLHATASGKVLLAHQSKPRVEQILDMRGMPQLTEHTITNRDQLYEELAEVRETGVAYNRGEHIEGVFAVSAPVICPVSHEVGALSANGPAPRFENDRTKAEAEEAVCGVADEFRLNLELAES